MSDVRQSINRSDGGSLSTVQYHENERLKEMGVDIPLAGPTTRSTLPRIVAEKCPRLSSPLTCWWSYLKGPVSSTAIPSPTPWLTASLNFKWFSIDLPFDPEEMSLKFTKTLNTLWLFVLLAAAYVVGLAFLVRQQYFLIPAESLLGCTSTYWLPDQGCGLNGIECQPFSGILSDFKCPAQCSSTVLENPRAVGSLEPSFVPLVVGGGDQGFNESSGIYRGDSFICAAAIHAGLISNLKGGCVSVALAGNHTGFISSSANGLTSIPFPSSFPLSFRLSRTNNLSGCTDLRNPALAYNILVTWALFFLLRPKPIVLFWCLVCVGFWHVTFFSEPRTFPPPISDAFGTFLPSLFVAYAFWQCSWRFVLGTFSPMPIERAIWYLVPFWAGVEFNVVTGRIPIDRLVASDIANQPGALAALLIIVFLLLFLVVNQLRLLRQAGLLLWYAGWYSLGGTAILVLSQMPGLQFRLHHYFAAILLVPLTAVPTRLSAVYQGFILGMFLNGVAAFDFDSIFQTAEELVRDGSLGTDLPTILTNSSNWNSSTPIVNQTITWAAITSENSTWDGFSLMVDDVERVASDVFSYSLAGLLDGIPHYFRLAFTKSGQSGDYTRAATLHANGTWTDPLPGPAA